MREIARVVARNKLLTLSQEELDAATQARDPMYSANRAGVYRASCRWKDNVLYLVGRDTQQRRVLACSTKQERTPFGGKPSRVEGFFATEIPMNAKNAGILQSLFPFLVPVTPEPGTPSIGFGDRLGNATPAHVRLAKQYQLFPFFAQQSMRELQATAREYDQVLADAVFGVFQEGYTDGFGADADHLRDVSQVKRTAKSAPSLVTTDISDYLRSGVDEMENRVLQEAFRGLPKKEQRRIRRTYSGRSINLGGVSVRFRPGDAERAAVKFLEGIGYAEKAFKAVAKRQPKAQIEFTVDEIPVVSTAADHYFIANEFRLREIPLYSIAFRFPGSMHKGVDFEGDTRAFDSAFTEHVNIAAALGGHRVSVHSGSDKFAIYPIVARRAGSNFHLKTSGTSWLEAMYTIADVDPDLYRDIHRLALEVYPELIQKYEVTADIEQVPDIESLRDRQLRDLFSNPHWRQLLHIAYGGILRNAEMAERIRATLHREEEAYYSNLQRHLGAHVEGLRIAKR